jgi:hypothetical protein
MALNYGFGLIWPVEIAPALLSVGKNSDAWCLTAKALRPIANDLILR